MEKALFEDTRALIARDVELESLVDTSNEEELLVLLAAQIDYMLQHKREQLMSLMYRLDISEHHVEAVLSPHAPVSANWGLAVLVLERQKQRIATKLEYKPNRFSEDDFWA